jgi:hypothetical protein
MRKLYRYHAEATSVAGFLQVLCANYLPASCVFYSQGLLKPHMNVSAIDADIIARYEIAISKHARCWRKRQGIAAVHLLRYRLFYLILASEGRHCFFERETNIKDARTSPIHLGDYAVSVQDGHSCVRLAPQTEQTLRDRFLGLACVRSAAALAREFHDLPYLPYKPVVWQELKILRAVNAKRDAGGKGLIAEKCIRRCRPIVRPFDRANADYDRSAEDYAARNGADAGGEALPLGKRASSAA